MQGRPLHFIFLCDCSGSMGMDGKIQALNTAIREVLPIMSKEQDSNIHAEVLVRAVKFSTGAQWHIAQPTRVSDVRWEDLTAGGVTDLGAALKLVADQLQTGVMDRRGLPPVLLLISDGMPTDDWKIGLKALMEQPWGKKAVRMAIAIGSDVKHETLQEFIAHPEIHPLQANNPEQLTKFIRWVSTSVTNSVSQSRGVDVEGKPSSTSPVQIPLALPDQDKSSGDPSVW